MSDSAGRSTRRLGGIGEAPRVVLFDLDDTLCDYASARALRLRLAFSAERHAAFGPTSDLARERLVADALATPSHGVDHFPELLCRHGIDDPMAAEAAMTWYRSHRYEGLRLFSDAEATIQALRQTDGFARRTIGVVTNGPADVQRSKIDLLGVGRFVDFVVISGEFGVAKPDPAIFQEALRLAAADPEEAVFVGDSPEFDIAGARAAGIRPIWLNRSARAWRDASPPPDHQIADLSELIGLLTGG
jgi:FMN hydrolase / 5-amino-6-(5-phospho-D-ribitylamino)uracil phosphatase